MVLEPTVFVVDDDPAVRDALKFLLEATDFQVESFASAKEFLDGYDASKPGCLLLDVRMPGMDGIELQRHLVDQQVDLPIIFLTAHGDIPMAVDVVRRGAMEFVEKPYDKDRLLQHIRKAVERDAELRRAQAESAAINERLATLTEREREVLDLLMKSKTPVQIAELHGTSRHTVGNQRASILKKMGADTVVELVNMVTRAGRNRRTLDAG